MVRILPVLLGLVCMVACSEKAPPKPKGPLQQFQLKGEIVQLDDKSQVATIQHQEIEGFMKAMTMEFPVKDKTEYEKLKLGMQITATLYFQPEDSDYWIAGIHPGEQTGAPKGGEQPVSKTP